MIGVVSALEVDKPVAAQAGNSSLNDCWTTIKLYLVPICMQLKLSRRVRRLTEPTHAASVAFTSITTLGRVSYQNMFICVRFLEVNKLDHTIIASST